MSRLRITPPAVLGLAALIGAVVFQSGRTKAPQSPLTGAFGTQRSTPAGGTSPTVSETAAAPATMTCPDGFQRLDSARGWVFVNRQQGVQSAKQLARQTLDALQMSFGNQRPQVVAAVGDPADQMVQTLFQASLNGQPIRGLVVAQAGSEGLTARVLMDAASRFADSLPAMAGIVQQAMPASAPAAAPLALHPASAGTEAINLPDGWKVIASAPGAIDADGPEGGLDLGSATQVYLPEFVQSIVAQGYPAPQAFVAPYTDPAHALEAVFPQMSSVLVGMGYPARHYLGLVEQAPVNTGQGQAAVLRFKWEMASQGEMQSLGLVSMAPTGPNTWMLYFSQLYAPADHFGDMLPTLLRIYDSWQTDHRVFQARLEEAAGQMQGTARLIQGANAYRQATMDQASKAWDLVIRGQWPIANTQTGGHTGPIDNMDLQPMIEAMNQGVGSNRYAPVPLAEL